MRRPSEAVELHMRKMGIVCAALLMGMVVFAAVVWYLVNRGGSSPPNGMPGYLAILFNSVALVAIVKAQLLPRLFPRPSGDAPEADLLAWHSRTTIVGYALREGAGFMALVGVMLTGRQGGGFAMAGLAILAMVVAWPRVEQLQSRGP